MDPDVKALAVLVMARVAMELGPNSGVTNCLKEMNNVVYGGVER